ncbi:MAG: NAD(P)-dependent alcohol dehydrogenase [Bacteroidales bacterium]
MKAVVCTQYGKPEGLQFKEVKKPVPKDDEVLIKIYATTAHIGDTRIRRADPFLVRFIFGLFKPKKDLILGMEISGIIENVGKNVKSFRKSDTVYALTGFGFGGYAEYRCLPEKVKDGTQQRKGLVAIKPENLTFEEAATVPAGGLTALKNLQKANISKGHKILINGASGSLGTYAIQIAKYYGAEVTAVCSSKNFDIVKSIGADKVIDYTNEDFTKKQDKYDILYDAVMKLKASRCRKVLKTNGIFLNNSGLPKIKNDDLLFLKYLIENNKLKPVIDRTYSIEDIVEAHRYVDMGHKRGNVAVRINDTYLTNSSGE